MSSRRKSSVPCMVRVSSDLHQEHDEPEVTMDKVASTDDSETSDSAWKNEITPLRKPENLNQQMFAKPEENQNRAQLLEQEHFAKEDQQPVIEDVGTREPIDGEGAKSESAYQEKTPRGYGCKYCPFSTQNLNDFKDHVDSSHPSVILNPLYICAACNFNTKKFDSLTEHNDRQHPGEKNFKFKRIKIKDQTILEQTIQGLDNTDECEVTNRHGEQGNNSVYPPCISTTVRTQDNIQVIYQGTSLKSHLGGLIQKDTITAVNINGTVVIPEPSLLQGLSHVTPLLQRPHNFNSLPKIAVPLNTTKYNPLLDDNLTLMTSFNKFPYPTHAELSWLTAASKHPEEQIKVWFTTQRLKQGITWSPEEVEEARKKMFNGSFPPAHHTLHHNLLVTSPMSYPSTKASQQTVVNTTVRHPGHVWSNTRSPAGISVGSSQTLKRPLPAHLLAAFGSESKRPVMAVAPHHGDPKDKGLMAPPPPPMPLKDPLSMAATHVPMEMKRPVAVPMVNTEMQRTSDTVPLMPPPSSPPSLLSKGKIFPTLGSQKAKPVVPLPPMVFPESLTRPMIVPPPIFAPPFNKTVLFPRTQPFGFKEKHSNTHALLAPDLKLPTSPPLVAPQIRRPTIIQSIHAQTKAHAPVFTLDGKKGKEQKGVVLKAGNPTGEKTLTPLADNNGVSRIGSQWPHNKSPAPHNNEIIHYDVEGGEMIAAAKPHHQQKSSVLTQFPLLERMKGKTAGQLKVLEESFLRNCFPTHSDMDNLSAASHLSHQEIDSWFAERRALRDNLEQALLNSMGSKRTGIGGISTVTEKQLHQQPQRHQTSKTNGIHKPTTVTGHLPPTYSLPAVKPSVPDPNARSVPTDSRSLVPLKEDFAQTWWPSPEDFRKLEGRSGRAHADLACRSDDGRRQGGSVEPKELRNNTTNGGHGLPLCSTENSPPGINPYYHGGAITNKNNNSTKVLEVELGWLMEQRTTGLRNQHDVIHNRFTGRLKQHNMAEWKNGGHNSGVMGGAREMFGSWLDERRSMRGGELLLLDKNRKLSEDTSGRLTG